MPDFQTILPVLRLSDLARSVGFYQSVLGFTLVWQRANDGGGENTMLAAGATKVLLSTSTHLGDQPHFTGTIYFNKTGIPAFVEAIKNRVELVWPLETMDYGQPEFGIRDPDGYMLAFAEAIEQDGRSRQGNRVS